MEHILSLSYGKDSIACLGAIEELGWPLDRIVHAEVWATDTIRADLPPMVDFKAKADKSIKNRWGIEVEHVRGPLTYEQAFYRVLGGRKRPGEIYGWPFPGGPYCNSDVKMPGLDKLETKDAVIYLGIACDEPNRFHSLSDTKKSPLIVWDKCNGDSSFSDCEIAATNCHESVRLFRYMWNGMMQGKSISEGHIMHGNKKLNEVRIHPTQKPVALYTWIFSRYAKPGYKVLDTHLGSGSSRIAAWNAGLDFVGCEINPYYFKTQEERFQAHTAQGNLFLGMEMLEGREAQP